MSAGADVPATVRIGPASYRVKLTKRLADDKLGLMHGRKSLIEVHPSQSASSHRDTLLHEVLHAICYESGLSHVMGVDDQSEESIIRVLTPSLLGVLRSNPDFLTFLTAAE